jgi:hypothetical protein
MLDKVYEDNLFAERQQLVAQGVPADEALAQATKIASGLRKEGAKNLLG